MQSIMDALAVLSDYTHTKFKKINKKLKNQKTSYFSYFSLYISYEHSVIVATHSVFRRRSQHNSIGNDSVLVLLSIELVRAVPDKKTHLKLMNCTRRTRNTVWILVI